MDDQQQTTKRYPMKQSASFAGGAAVTMALIDAIAHLGPTGLLISGLAGYVAWKHGPELYELASREVRGIIPSHPSEKIESGERHGRGFWDRAMGRYPDQGVQAQDGEQGEEWREDWYDQDEDPAIDQSMFTFSQLLASGFKPTLHKIFLGRLSDGTDVFVEAKDLCHIALAGSTGQGKTSLMRLIMAQLCSIRVSVVLLNPHYMVYDRDHNEDWTPFTPYLARNPLDYVKVDNIAFMLKWIIEKTLARRMELARAGKSVGKPYFIVIDELPAIVAERKECAGYVAKLLREGRKYGIYLIVASQDFLVKTTGMDAQGGAVRKCFRTACYVGGDSTTANVLLEKQATPIPETDLGKGMMMLRCSATSKAVIASVPYCDNEALYQLLGPSTFTIHHSPETALPELGETFTDDVKVNTENAVNEPVKPVNASVNNGEYSPESENYSQPSENYSPAFTPAEEVQVLLAYAEMLKAEKQVTRTGIRDLLDWDNKQYQRIIKPVCDKHHIG